MAAFIRLFLVVLLVSIGPSSGASKEGIDQIYKKQDGGVWGAILKAFFEYDKYDEAFALVVGISDYRDSGFDDLPTEEDAIRIKDYLLNEAGFDYVHLVTEDKVTKDRIEELMVDDFPQLVGADDRFVLYWSGHGETRPIGNGSRGYLPVFGSKKKRYSSMISMQDIAEWDTPIKAAQVLYLLDSCFSGLAGAVAQSTDKVTAIKRLGRPSRHILTAGTADEQTIAIDSIGGSVFTRAILDGLRGAADSANAYPKDGIVTLRELQGYVSNRVDIERRKAGWRNSITPQLRDLGVSNGEFFFLMDDVGSANPESVAYNNPNVVVTPQGSLAPNKKTIREMQLALASLGYQPGDAHGEMGLLTRSALRKFQQDNQLPDSGELDHRTKARLEDALTRVAILGAKQPAQSPLRGRDGHVGLVYWQAPSILNPYLSGGTKDIEAASLTLEPLARHDERAKLVAWLAAEIPTVENGGIADDLTSITWRLKKGVKWADGTALTAHDVVFTADYCMDPEMGCQQLGAFDNVREISAVDDHTVKITFDRPMRFPYRAFVGSETPVLQKAQFAGCKGSKAYECSEQNFAPIGTGPFIPVDFRANDVLEMKANPYFRDPSKPAFATLTLRGGGDAAAAARSVLITGEFDYAWNLQINSEILRSMESGGDGTVVSTFGTGVERLMLNFTNPDPKLKDKRSTVAGGKHPFLTDPLVSRALSLAIDRKLLAEVGYGAAGRATCNVMPSPPIYASKANDACLVQDIRKANALLDEAGWTKGNDGVRSKDGVRLSILYQTSTNAVRQETQALIKQWWSEIGVETELRDINAAIFFGGDPSSPDTFQRFYADIEMYTNIFPGTDPEAYMGNWLCKEVPSPENDWFGSNVPRYCDEEYEALFVRLQSAAGIFARAAIIKKMNDKLVQAGAMIPLIQRGRVSAHINTLKNVKLNGWDSELWNVHEWERVK